MQCPPSECRWKTHAHSKRLAKVSTMHSPSKELELQVQHNYLAACRLKSSQQVSHEDAHVQAPAGEPQRSTRRLDQAPRAQPGRVEHEAPAQAGKTTATIMSSCSALSVTGIRKRQDEQSAWHDKRFTGTSVLLLALSQNGW